MANDRLKMIYEDYARTYAMQICEAMREIDPDRFAQLFGSLENCIREVYDDAIQWIQKWGPRWIMGIAARTLERLPERIRF